MGQLLKYKYGTTDFKSVLGHLSLLCVPQPLVTYAVTFAKVWMINTGLTNAFLSLVERFCSPLAGDSPVSWKQCMCSTIMEMQDFKCGKEGDKHYRRHLNQVFNYYSVTKQAFHICLLSVYFCSVFHMLSINQHGLLDLISFSPFRARLLK